MLKTHVSPNGLRRLDEIETLGTVAAVMRFRPHDLDDYLDVPLADLLASPVFATLFDEMRLGMHTPSCPLLVLHPVHDQIIDVADVDGQVHRYIDAGVHVRYLRDRLSEHLTLLPLSAPTALDWLTDRFAGRPLPASGIKTVWSMAASRSSLRGLIGMALVATRMLTGRALTRWPWQQRAVDRQDQRPAA